MAGCNGHHGNIDVVLFDFGGVLAEEGFRNGLSAIAKANNLDEKGFIQKAYDIVYSSGYVLGKAPERIFWDELRQETGLRGEDAAFKKEIISRFVIRDWMIGLVKKLKAGGITTGILSDQTDILDLLNKRDNFFRWFDHIFNSYHSGKSKKDVTLFDDIAKTLGAEQAGILFIDDDAGNVERARHKGWKAIHYTDKESFQKEFERVLPPAQNPG